MVYNDIVAANTYAITVTGIYIVTQATAHITNNRVIGLNYQWTLCDADAVTRRCLTGYSDVRISDTELTLEKYGARHLEYDRARAAGLGRFAQRPGTAVVKIRDNVEITSPPTLGPLTETFRSGKSRNRLVRPDRLIRPGIDNRRRRGCFLLEVDFHNFRKMLPAGDARNNRECEHQN